MLKKLFFALIISLSAIITYSQADNFIPIDDYKILMQKFSPRDENSQNERNLIEYIKLFCDSYDLNYKLTKINNQQDIITNSYNIEITLNGNKTNSGKLIVLCPLNSEIINQNFYDNSISIQIIFDLILKCSNHSFDKDIVFVFSGANKNEKEKYSGAKYFLQNSEDLSKSLVTIIDILNLKSKIRFSGSINRRAIPAIILKSFLKLNKNNYGLYFNRNEIYRARFNIKNEDNMASVFLKENINSVLFYNREENYNEEINFDSNYEKTLNNFFYEWLIEFDKINIPFDMDYHYIYYNFFGFNILISEFLLIIFYMIIIFFTIISRLILPAFRKAHLKLLFNNIFYFIVLFFSYFVLSLLPLIIFMPISFITSSHNAYLNSTLIYFLNIFFIPLLIIYIFFKHIKIFFKKHHSYIYIYGAFITSLLNFFMFFIFDISIAIIYLWSTVTLTLSQFIKNNYKIKYALYSLSALGLIFLIFDLAFIDNIAMIKSINPFIINFIFSIMTFPFILLLLRGLSIYLSKNKALIKKRNLAKIIFTIASTSLIILIIISIFTEQKKDILKVNLISEQNNNLSFLKLESNLPIGELYIESGIKSETVYITKREKELLVYTLKKPYYLNYNFNNQNDSFAYSFNINSGEMMEYLNIFLITPRGNSPVDSNFIFNKIDNPEYIKYNPKTEDVYFFNPGRNPGVNVNFELELQNNINNDLYFVIDYPFIDKSIFYIKKPDKIIEYKSTYIEKFELSKIINSSISIN